MSDLFDSTVDHGNQGNPQIDPDKDYLTELVGEGKKFKTPAELARGKYEADQFIERLKREQAALREELNSRKRLEDIADLLSPNKQHSSSEGTPPNRNGGEEGTDNKNLNPDDLEKLIEDRLTKREKERLYEQNFNTVKSKLAEVWGPDASTKLSEVANTLGVGKEFLNNLAKEQPKAFFKLVGVDTQSNNQGQRQEANDLFAPPRSSVNSSGFTPNVTGERTMSYYDKIKRDNPREYWTPRIQNQMHQDAMRLGEKFFDRK